MRASYFDRAIHPHNVLGSIIGLVVVKTRKNAVRNLFDDQFIVCFTMFTLPEDAMGMSLHVLDVALCAAILLVCECDGEAGFNLLCIHNEIVIFRVLPLFAFQGPGHRRNPEFLDCPKLGVGPTFAGNSIFCATKTAIIIAKMTATSQTFDRIRSVVFVPATLMFKRQKRPLGGPKNALWICRISSGKVLFV